MSFHYQRLGEDVESTPLYSTKTNSGGEKKSMFARMSLLAVLFLAFAGYLYTTPTKPQSFGLSSTEESTSKSSSSENFDAYGRYIMRNFDQVKPMSNFLAGLGGLWGIPMWAFYCNRGQGIAGFGVQNKDGSIMKFSTAEKAYLITPFAGFRTFLKGRRGKVLFTAMPFFPVSADSHSKPERNMMIGQNEMEIEEVAEDIALKTNILYFTIPDEDFPGLVRRTTFTNLDKKSSLHLEVLDGLGKLIPAGLSNSLLDALGRTMEGNYAPVFAFLLLN